MENKLCIQDNDFLKVLHFPIPRLPCLPSVKSSRKWIQTAAPTSTGWTPQDHCNWAIGSATFGFLCGRQWALWEFTLHIKPLMPSVGCLKAESLNEKILGEKKILALICICSSYFIAPNTMCVLYRGLRLTVCLWYALRSSDGRCYLNTSNLMLKCLEFPVDICTRALLPSQMKNIWNP